MNRVIIGLGSNIEPALNIQKTKGILAQKFRVLAESTFKVTKPVGTVEQPDFINGALLVETELNQNQLKAQLRDIEVKLGRAQDAIRYDPRTIDLDIVVWNDTIVDRNFYERGFLKESALELIPDLKY